MRLVSLDRRRERLHVELSLCEGRVRTHRAIQRDDDCEQDEERVQQMPRRTLSTTPISVEALPVTDRQIHHPPKFLSARAELYFG